MHKTRRPEFTIDQQGDDNKRLLHAIKAFYFSQKNLSLQKTPETNKHNYKNTQKKNNFMPITILCQDAAFFSQKILTLGISHKTGSL